MASGATTQTGFGGNAVKTLPEDGSTNGVFSIYGYLIVLVAAIILCLLSGPACLMVSLFILFTYSIRCERAALHRMVRLPVILFMTLLILFSLFFSDLTVSAGELGAPSSSVLLITLICRTLLLLLAVQIVASRVSPTDLNAIFERLGFHHLGFVLGVALHMLPCLHRNAIACRNAMRMRGALHGLSLKRVASEFRWIRAILQQMMRHADAITVTARTRGFGLNTATKPLPGWRFMDTVPLLLTCALVYSNQLWVRICTGVI